MYQKYQRCYAAPEESRTCYPWVGRGSEPRPVETGTRRGVGSQWCDRLPLVGEAGRFVFGSAIRGGWMTGRFFVLVVALTMSLTVVFVSFVSYGAPAGAQATGDPVFVGAGDIGNCSGTGDEATANLLDGIEGTVFTTGDNAYPDGADADFANCYDPSWGRFKARTKPAVGNHEYGTAGAIGYFNYFGAA